MKPLLNHLLVDIIKNIFESSSQYNRTTPLTALKKVLRSPCPVRSAKLRPKLAATNATRSSTPVIDDGSTCAQMFVGTKTLVPDVCSMKTDKQLASTLEDSTHKRGEMFKLVSDVSNHVKDMWQASLIDN